MMFFYRVRDSQGRVKTGRFEAANRQAAEQRFRAEGWCVEALQPCEPSPGANQGPPSGRQRVARQKPPVRLARPRPSLKKPLPWGKIGISLVVLGMVWGSFDWWSVSHEPAEVAREQRWKLSLRGELPQETQRVRFCFPELPLQIDRSGDQLGQGRFNLEMNFTSLRPTYGEAYFDEHKVALNCTQNPEGLLFTWSKP